LGETAKRVATAAVLVPALLVAIFLDSTHWSVVAIAVLFATGAQDEYLRMAIPATEEDNAGSLRLVAGLLGAAVVLAPSVWDLSALPPLLTFGAVCLALTVLLRKRHLEQAGRHFGVALSGLLYVPLLMSVLPLLKRGGQAEWLTVTLCMAFFSDTVAYFFGRAFGKHKLYPAVSPGKTWEGSFGGILGSCLATVGVGSFWILPDLPISHAIGLGIVASICGQTGDLVESMLKRTFGVKDSGKLLPGHGGMLDRIDALVFVAPVAYYYIDLVAT
jgi:phosphatidate cytidylyltransferase